MPDDNYDVLKKAGYDFKKYGVYQGTEEYENTVIDSIDILDLHVDSSCEYDIDSFLDKSLKLYEAGYFPDHTRYIAALIARLTLAIHKLNAIQWFGVAGPFFTVTSNDIDAIRIRSDIQ